jgi:hypothetical protein
LNPFSEYEKGEDGHPVLGVLVRPRNLLDLDPFFTRGRCNLVDLNSMSHRSKKTTQLVYFFDKPVVNL